MSITDSYSLERAESKDLIYNVTRADGRFVGCVISTGTPDSPEWVAMDEDDNVIGEIFAEAGACAENLIADYNRLHGAPTRVAAEKATAAEVLRLLVAFGPEPGNTLEQDLLKLADWLDPR